MENSSSASGIQDFMANSSLPVEDDRSFYHRSVVVRVLGSFSTIFIALVAVSCNSAVIHITFHNETLRANASNIYSVYLSIIDIVTSIFVMIPSAISVALDYWPFGDIMCTFNATMFNGGACLTAKLIAIISLDRAYAVNYPFQYAARATRGRVAIACLIPVLLSVVDVILIGTQEGIQYDYFEGICAVDFRKTLHRKSYFYTVVILSILTPTAIIGTSYASIISVARKQRNNTHRLFIRINQQNPFLNAATEKDIPVNKTIISVVAVMLSFVFSFSLNGTIRVTKIFYEANCPPFDYLGAIFVFVSSAVNPFIYAIFRKDYRDAFIRLSKQIAGMFRDENRVRPF